MFSSSQTESLSSLNPKAFPFFPLVSGNRHSTFCLYEFDYPGTSSKWSHAIFVLLYVILTEVVCVAEISERGELHTRWSGQRVLKKAQEAGGRGVFRNVTDVETTAPRPDLAQKCD